MFLRISHAEGRHFCIGLNVHTTSDNIMRMTINPFARGPFFLQRPEMRFWTAK